MEIKAVVEMKINYVHANKKKTKWNEFWKNSHDECRVKEGHEVGGVGPTYITMGLGHIYIYI